MLNSLAADPFRPCERNTECYFVVQPRFCLHRKERMVQDLERAEGSQALTYNS